MAKEYLDKDGLLYFWQKIKSVFVTDVNYDTTNKKITKTKNGSTSDVVTVATLKTDMNIDVGVTGVKGSSESTYRTGYVNLSAANVGAAASSHTHGNITNAGALQATDISIANGDKLVVTDSSNSNKVARTSVAFDGSTTATALTPKGTFEAFAKAADIPTKTSDLTNDSDFVSDSSYVHTDNNYTSTDKTKLDGIESGAEVNVLEGVQANGSDLTITNKKVNIPVFTPATASAAGAIGLVPAPPANTIFKYQLLWGDATFKVPTISDTISTTNISYYLKRLGDDGAETGKHFFSIDSATTGLAGLMSAADKTKLNKLVFDSNDLIDSSILPSYVDDVIEAYARSGQTALSSTWLATGSASGTVITPETGKIYVLMADSGDYAANTQFRWGGTAYVKLADGGVSSITNAEIDTILAS